MSRNEDINRALSVAGCDADCERFENTSISAKRDHATRWPQQVRHHVPITQRKRRVVVSRSPIVRRLHHCRNGSPDRRVAQSTKRVGPKTKRDVQEHNPPEFCLGVKVGTCVPRRRAPDPRKISSSPLCGTLMTLGRPSPTTGCGSTCGPGPSRPVPPTHHVERRHRHRSLRALYPRDREASYDDSRIYIRSA